ncbi:hypothetical protein CCACVL1_05135 [Corchorus capsularis]|uniref:PGG domain-containing protein n=1 Tax=Corchorus capsularis TaxID=210143 RepID=A0A1R3JMB2_COCAP|nr:hypothetical protein CCACVL1_05135 [Corchorus capsularis]
MARHLIYYNKCQTQKQIFTETHKTLIKDGSEWPTKTSESCSLIAALIATAAFAIAANIPNTGSVHEPVLNEPIFGVFAISSLIAICFSVTALASFTKLEKENSTLTSDYASLKKAEDEDASTFGAFKAQVQKEMEAMKPNAKPPNPGGSESDIKSNPFISTNDLRFE